MRGTQIDRANHQEFWNAARAQRVCAVCGKPGDFDPHHVVYEQHLRGRGLPRFDTRNALRLCKGPGRCHRQHHNGRRRVWTIELTDDNITYAFEVMGVAALDYFARYYDNSGPDPRITHEYERLAA